jgi:hypothetical protein
MAQKSKGRPSKNTNIPKPPVPPPNTAIENQPLPANPEKENNGNPPVVEESDNTFNPLLDSDVDVKAYQRPPVNDFIERVEEGENTIPIIDIKDEIKPLPESGKENANSKENANGNDMRESSLPPVQSRNDDYDEQSADAHTSDSDMSTKDKKEAAAAAADVCLNLYEDLHKIARSITQINEQELIVKAQKGEIDLQLALQVDENTSYTLPQIAKDFNTQLEDILSLSDDTRREIRKPLVKVLTKHGVGLTPEQELAFVWGRDLLTKTAMCISLNKQTKMLIKLFSTNPPPEEESAPAINGKKRGRPPKQTDTTKTTVIEFDTNGDQKEPEEE